MIDRVLEGLGKQHSQLSPETRALMAGYDWPGNVRELRNVVERALTLGDQVEFEGPAAAASSSGTAGLNFKQAKERLVIAFERDYLRDLLGRCHGNISRAAREAGIDRVHMHRLLRKHGLEDKG